MTQVLGSESRKNETNIASKLGVGIKDKERQNEGTLHSSQDHFLTEWGA